MTAENNPAAYVVGQTVKLLNVPEYGGWATGYIESASCGVYGVRVQGLKLHTVTAQHLEPLDTPAPEDIPARLEYLRGEIHAERISTGELIELQGLAAHIDAGDVELLQWAGVPEFTEDTPRPVDAVITRHFPDALSVFYSSPDYAAVEDKNGDMWRVWADGDTERYPRFTPRPEGGAS